MREMVICPLCRRENEGSVRFCRYCGRLLIGPALDMSEGAPAPHYAGDTTGAFAGEAAARERLSARLVIYFAPTDEDGRPTAPSVRKDSFDLPSSTITIGRAQGCDILLDGDQLISRRHAIISYESGHYVLVDQGSSNGTLLNSEESRDPQRLYTGDRITIGHHELIFEETRVPEEPVGPTAEASPQAVVAAAGPTAVLDGGSVAVAQHAIETAKQASVTRLAAELAASSSRNAAQTTAPEVEAMRARLVEASESLAREANTLAALAERRRRAMVDARERLSDALTLLKQEVTTTQSSTAELAALARQTAENPNDIEQLKALAAHASEIAAALSAGPVGSLPGSLDRDALVGALEAIVARLAEVG